MILQGSVHDKSENVKKASLYMFSHFHIVTQSLSFTHHPLRGGVCERDS